MLPDSIKKFIDIFSKLPSIGPRQATRFAFYLVNLGKSQINEIAAAVADLKNLKICKDCFFVFAPSGRSSDRCSICSDPARKRDVIMILEKETDLLSIEKTKKFNGRYLVLGDLKKTGMPDTAQKLRIKSLKTHIIDNLNGSAEEIILAINPTTVGDLSASLIAQELKGYAKKISRLGRGLPTGGEIEFADEETLSSALERRN